MVISFVSDMRPILETLSPLMIEVYIVYSESNTVKCITLRVMNLEILACTICDPIVEDSLFSCHDNWQIKIPVLLNFF